MKWTMLSRCALSLIFKFGRDTLADVVYIYIIFLIILIDYIKFILSQVVQPKLLIYVERPP